MKIRLVLCGSGRFGLASFERLAQNADIEIVGVVSQPARPTGRRQEVHDTPIADWAKKNGFPLITPTSLRGNVDVLTTLKTWQPNLLVVADYGLLIPPEWLSMPPHGAINIHGSLLPRYRGAAPIAYALLNGDKITGVTFMRMDVGLDTGPIIHQLTWPIPAAANAEFVEEALATLASQHIENIVRDWVSGKLQARPQSSTGVSLAPKISVDDGRATWDSAVKLERKVRAFQPWPSVWTTWQKYRLKILSAEVERAQVEVPPGTIVAAGKTCKIACGDGWLLPTLVQFSGRRPQAASTVPGSYPGFIGSRLPG